MGKGSLSWITWFMVWISWVNFLFCLTHDLFDASIWITLYFTSIFITSGKFKATVWLETHNLLHFPARSFNYNMTSILRSIFYWIVTVKLITTDSEWSYNQFFLDVMKSIVFPGILYDVIFFLTMMCSLHFFLFDQNQKSAVSDFQCVTDIMLISDVYDYCYFFSKSVSCIALLWYMMLQLFDMLSVKCDVEINEALYFLWFFIYRFIDA